MKQIITAISICLLSMGVSAQNAADSIILKFKIQSQKVADGTGDVSDGTISLRRGKLGAEPYMLRAYCDVPVSPDTTFVLSYEVKVEGAGSAQGIIFNGDRQGRWNEKNLKYTESKNKCDFTQISTVATSSPNTYNLRLDLRANGADTAVTYRNITLNKLGEKKNIVLAPSDSAVVLDGKLDEPLWKNAVRISPFHILGDVTHQSTLKNEVLLAVKDGYLYIGYRLEEPNTSGIKALRPSAAAALENTLGIYADDCVETFLSTDQVSYAQVIVNAAGVKHWEQVNTGAPSRTWYPSEAGSFTGEWDAKAVVGVNEWTCEKRIKISDLFRKNIGGEQTLFVNFTRHRTQGKEENLTWVPLPGQFFAVPKEFAAIKLNLPAVANASDSETPVASIFTKTLSVPDLLLAGAPVKLIKNSGEFKLPLNIKINEQNVAIDSGVKKMLENALHVDGGGEAVVNLAVRDIVSDDPSLKASEKDKLKSPEAFKLELAPGRAAITGRTRDGVLRGIATLILMANRARLTDGSALPALTLLDAPRMAFRGWQVGGKSLEALKRTIDAGYLLRFNKLLIYLDSFGGPTLFPFDSYPIGGRTWTKPELIEAFNYARARGLEPIPYFASWGRTQYLKNMPGGAKLLVDDPEAVQKGYANLDAANPEACKVMLKLQEEIIDTLKPEGFCVALDEIHFGKMVTSPAAKAKNWKPSDWLVEAVKASDELFRKKGVKMYIWGDMFDPGQNGKHLDMTGRELLARLPKDIVILDWKYDGKLDYTVDYPSIKLFSECGFTTVGCPWFRPKSIPRLAYSVNKHRAAGLLLTSWNSTTISELLPEVIRATSLTAYYAWSPEDCDLEHLQFLPDAIMQGAAYWAGKSPANKITSLSANEDLVSNGGLAGMMGVSATTDTAFIAAPFKNYRGLKLEVFSKDGRPGAVVMSGRETTASIKNGDFAEGTGLSGWEIESANAGTFGTESSALKITRTVPKKFMRAYQDISIDAKKQYLVRYKVKTSGSGGSLAWTYSGDSKFKWDESKSVYSSSKEREWKNMEIQLPPGFASLRICFSVDGEGATAWFRDVELIEKRADSGTPPAAAAVKPVVIPVNAAARNVTFMHAVNRQIIIENLDGENTMRKKFNGVIPGSYMVIYADGSKALIPLTYRVNIAAVNDPALGREMDAGLFGTLGGAVFMNLPTYTWANPHPDKIIKSIEILPGNTKDISLLVFGIALD